MRLLIMTLAVLLFFTAKAQKQKDHPALSKYEGSEIVAYRQQDFTPYVLGIDKQEEKDERFRDHGKYFSKFIDLEGKLTRIQYRVPKSEGLIKVFRNYEEALKNAGYEILFTTSDKESNWPFWNEDVYHHEWGIKTDKLCIQAVLCIYS